MFSQSVPQSDKGGIPRTRPFQFNSNESRNTKNPRPFSIFSGSNSAQRMNQGAYILSPTSNHPVPVHRTSSLSQMQQDSSNTAADNTESSDISPEPDRPADRGLFVHSVAPQTSGLSLFSKAPDTRRVRPFSNQQAPSSPSIHAQRTQSPSGT
jgi:hypothetical protein